MMDAMYQILLFLLHLNINTIEGLNKYFSAKHTLLKSLETTVYYINHGDEVVLYNVECQSAIMSVSQNGGFIPLMSNIKNHEEDFLWDLVTDRDAHRDKVFTVFKIFRVDEQNGRINNTDKIRLEYAHRYQGQRLFFDENGLTMHLDDVSGASDHNVCANQLRHGSKIEFGAVVYSNGTIAVQNSEAKRSTDSSQSSTNCGHNWKIFIAGRTLDKLTRDKIFSEKEAAERMLQMQMDKLHSVQNESSTRLFAANQTIIDMKIQTKQMILKLNASENGTIGIKHRQQFEQQLHQLNQTLLQSESDYHVSLQTKQTKISNLNHQITNLETVAIGLLIAFGIVSFVLLITCVRCASKKNEEKVILRASKLHGWKHGSVGSNVLSDKQTVGEQSPGDFSRTKTYSINQNCDDKTTHVLQHNLEAGETDIGLDIIQGVISNQVKPSFMVRTQDGHD